MGKPVIMITNDDGIESPGLWAIASEMAEIGEVWITAPNRQFSGAGFSYRDECKNVVTEHENPFPGKDIRAFSIDGTPAATVFIGFAEILKRKPDLVVSGINYGENIGSSCLASGTVGAALQAAVYRMKAMAVSLGVDPRHGENYMEHDFSAAARFARKMAEKFLAGEIPDCVDILKIDVPPEADENTPWKITRQSSERYWKDQIVRDSVREPKSLSPAPMREFITLEEDSDVHAFLIDRCISVCPLKADLTARVDLSALNARLH